ncbi:3-dehydroquinate synthase [Alphaproteobacteria bacterium]|nr:3-dehydroquinate synthase [Alphaproteobacteria bacterium]
MKTIIKIKTQLNSYSIVVEKNSIIPFIKNEKKSKKKIFIIIDKKVKYILNNIEKNKNINIIKINGSEKIKSISNYWNIISLLLKLNIDRSSTLIAIGGGTVGDLSSFVASTILRGVRFILVPTTLLSQVDSSIGGKNGINAPNGKNLIGTFFQPDKVIIDPKVLCSLSKRELKSGYAEILKHALINDKVFYKWLIKYNSNVLDLDKQYITKAIVRSIKIKAKFVQFDEKETLTNSSSRAMLNFGHTFGHALETMNDYSTRLTHGEAISIGMASAAKISYKKKNITEFEYNKILDHLNKIGLPHHDKRINSNKIYKLMQSDKKNTEGKINLVLLKKIGQAYFERGLDKEKIKKLLN